MSFEAKQSLEGKENLQDISDERQQVLTNVAKLTQNETNPDRAKAMSDLAPKLIDLFPEFLTIPDVQDLLLLNPDTNRSVIQDTLASLSDQHLSAFNKALDPSSANFKKSQGVLATFFEERIKEFFVDAKEQQRIAQKEQRIAQKEQRIAKENQNQEEKTEIVADLSQQVDVNKQEVESTEKQLVEATKRSQKNLLTSNPDLASQIASASDLDITDDDDAETTQTKKAKQQALAESLWYDSPDELHDIIENSQYAEADLTTGQLLSFLQTKQALANNNITSAPFLTTVAQIRNLKF